MLGVRLQGVQMHMEEMYAMAPRQDREACLLEGGPLEDGLHRAKDLVLGDCHVICHAAEYCGLHKVALLPCTTPS